MIVPQTRLPRRAGEQPDPGSAGPWHQHRRWSPTRLRWSRYPGSGS